MKAVYRDAFASMQSAVAHAASNDRLSVFSNACREAFAWLGADGAPIMPDLVDRLQEIVDGTTLRAEHTDDEIQAVMTNAALTAGPKSLRPSTDRASSRDEGQSAGAAVRQFHLVPFDAITLGRERRYLIKGILPNEGLAVVWGPPKCGKNFITADMLMHVASGWEYRGRRVDQGPVVYLALEGAKGFQARAAAQRIARPPPKDVPFFLMTERVNLVADHSALIEAIKAQTEAPKAVVVDTLNRSLPGSESKDEDMAGYLRAADAIREAFGCLVVIVHHSGVEKSRPRGHTSLTGAADAQLKVERNAAGNIALTVEWMKDGAEGDVLVSRLDPVTVGTDEDDDDVTSCVVLPVAGEDAGARRETKAIKLPPSAQIALRALRNAVICNGQDPPATGEFPNAIKVVSIAAWRAEAYRAGISDGDANAKKKAFSRSRERLIAAGVVGERDDFAWVV